MQQKLAETEAIHGVIEAPKLAQWQESLLQCDETFRSVTATAGLVEALDVTEDFPIDARDAPKIIVKLDEIDAPTRCSLKQ